MSRNKTILFDLDGTLLDTAPDLTYALNLLRKDQQLPELPNSDIRSIANLGSRAMLKHAFDIDHDHPDFLPLREKFLNIYQKHIANSTRFFPAIERVLLHLDENHIPWGIVTNKPTEPTLRLLKTLQYDHRPACIVCGDTLEYAKPSPEPVLHALWLMQAEPKQCLFIGDAQTDVIAGKAAGVRSLVALYGYIGGHEDPMSWEADGYIHKPEDILEWV